MKKIGLIVAVEMKAVLEKYGEPVEEKEYRSFKVLTYKINGGLLYVIKSGAGEIYASSATQFLIDKFEVDMIVNFGVVGGLTEEMKTSKLSVITKIVHYDFDTSAVDNCEVGRYLEYPDVYIPADEALVEKACAIAPELKKVVCASADKFVDEREKKEKLHKDFGADICEMESAGIALTANRAKVPCLFIKVVSDSISGGAAEFAKEINRASELCIDITDKIINGIEM